MSPDTVVDRWLATWSHVRAVEVRDLDGWPVVQVGSPSRETELVCLDPGLDVLGDLLRHVAGDRRAMLTVVGPDVGVYRAAPVPSGVRVDRDDETLMTAVLGDPVPQPLAAGLTARWDVDAHRATYSVEVGESVAAVGTVGVTDGWATYDRVETTPAHRRRGLGRHVMATLTALAVEQGATRGVLAASAEGRRLYQRLGWEPALEMLSFMGD